MTYAPDCLAALRRYAIDKLGAPPAGVGIVGDGSHQHGYHLGWDRLVRAGGWSDYSATTARDRRALKGPTRNAACAFDLTTRSTRHRAWVKALIRDLLAGEDYTAGIRAVNATLDGRTAYRWDREEGFRRRRTDDSHLVHTHLEFYRDVIAAGADLLPVLTRPLAPPAKPRTAPAPPADHDDGGELGVSAEEKLDDLIELFTYGTRAGKTATAPDEELGSAYIAVSLKLMQQIAVRLNKTNELLAELVARK